jgi:signal peptide peptidase SppA
MNTTVLHRILSQPWAIQPEVFASLTQQAMQLSSVSSRPETKELPPPRAGYVPLNGESAMAAALYPLPDVPANTTVVMLWGVLGRGWEGWERDYMGAVDVDEAVHAVEAAETENVVLWFRSPGGISTGIPEAASAIREAGKAKRVLAFSDTLCASAAYWLAAQCSAIHATPTAMLGSIGVYIAFYDLTAMMEKMGVKLDLFKAGRLKAMGLIGNPLDEEARTYLQDRVDSAYTRFRSDVLRNREIELETMQGQTFSEKAALDRNLADKHWPSASRFFAALGKGKV